MASIFFITRGHKDHVDKFVEQMKSQWFPLDMKVPVTDTLGRKFDVQKKDFIEAQMRPIQLWEYILPEAYMDPMCQALGLHHEKENYFDKEPGNQANSSFISGFGAKGYLEALRIALKAEKLPKADASKPRWAFPIYRNFVNILGIGWRKDQTGESLNGFEHELI